jgi:hypothetical protein
MKKGTGTRRCRKTSETYYTGMTMSTGSEQVRPVYMLGITFAEGESDFIHLRARAVGKAILEARVLRLMSPQ